MTENIRKALDEGNVGYGVFVYLQKSFDAVRLPGTISKTESLLDSCSFKWLV